VVYYYITLCELKGLTWRKGISRSTRATRTTRSQRRKGWIWHAWLSSTF